MNKIWGMLELSLKTREHSKGKKGERTQSGPCLSSHCHLRIHGWNPLKEQPLVGQELKLEEEEKKIIQSDP